MLLALETRATYYENETCTIATLQEIEAIAYTAPVVPPNPLFVISVKTDNVGTSNNDQFTLPMVGNYDVDWGDGNIDLAQAGTQTHTYSIAGTYEINVTGGDNIQFNNVLDKLKLLDVINWGSIAWKTMTGAFNGCENMTISATGSPDLSICLSLSSTFKDCSSMNSPTLNAWDTSNVGSMASCFRGATIFNQPLSNWDLTSCTSIADMFVLQSAFNQDIGSWNTSAVTNMFRVFRDSTNFDQDLSGWDVNQVVQFQNFMDNIIGLSTVNYDAMLIAWDAQGAMSYSGTVNFGGSQYTLGGAAEAARTSLISKWGGIIDGGGITPLTTNLVASYSFDTDFTDYTGNNDLTVTGNVLAGVTGGVVDDCADFEGTDDYTVAADSDDFSFTDGVTDLPFSVSFWLNVDTVPASGTWILSKRLASPTTEEYQITFNSSTFQVLLASQGSTNSYLYATFPYTPTTGGTTWEHFTVTYDGSETFSGIKAYINGVSQTSTNLSSGTYLGMTNTATIINIGSRSFGPTEGEFNGKMDEFHVWKNRELTQAEVTDIYTTELGGTSILP